MLGKKKLKIVYLGGFYFAEFSMLQSFKDNDSEIIFLIDTNTFGISYKSSAHYSNHNAWEHIKTIPAAQLQTYLEQEKPDVVIHRYYRDEALMHGNAYDICKTLDIPFIRYVMETDNEDVSSCNGNNYDALLYAHNTKYFTEQVKKSNRSMVFYPYGVSSFETMLDVERTKNIGAIGYYRNGCFNRNESLNMFLDSLNEVGEKLNVYGGPSEWVGYGRHNEAIINERYITDDSIKIINEHKIMLNFESLPHVEGCYSHKMFQTLGCGIPTITQYRDTVNELFKNGKNNIIMINNKQEIIDWIKELLSNTVLYRKMSIYSYEFMHDNFEWYPRLYKIIKKLNYI